MEAVSGDMALHDGEYEEAVWFSVSEALERLAFANEVGIVELALRILSATPNDSSVMDLDVWHPNATP